MPLDVSSSQVPTGWVDVTLTLHSQPLFVLLRRGKKQPLLGQISAPVAVCRGVLQCVSLCSSMLQYDAHYCDLVVMTVLCV